MAGVLYLIAGAGKLGFIATFLSQPILSRYLNGIALIILVGQLPKLLGYPSGKRARAAAPGVVERVALAIRRPQWSASLFWSGS